VTRRAGLALVGIVPLVLVLAPLAASQPVSPPAPIVYATAPAVAGLTAAGAGPPGAPSNSTSAGS
jgi:hypothetical protein